MATPSVTTIVFTVIMLTAISAALAALYSSCKEIEKFSDAPSSTTSFETQVLKIYNELFNRQPNAVEFKKDAYKLQTGQISLDGMKQRMLDSIEYGNKMKLQSNELTPELPKMLSDRDMLNRIAEIYKQECGKEIPSVMVLPLRDVYIMMDYNEYAFRAMFRDGSYKEFEINIMTTPDLNHPQVMDEFSKKFNKNTLVTVGQGIAKTEKDRQSDPVGAAPTCKYDRSLDDTDSDSCLSLTKALEDAQAKFDKNAAALALSEDNGIPDFNTEAARTNIRIPTHRGDMVLIPEMAWSVPQYRAPVCTTLGQPQLLQSISSENKILKGTPLKVAKNDTQVGSIMPKFKYQEYIDIKQ